MEQQLVVFELANECYGVDIGMVEGIIKMQGITAVPHAPSFVEGVTNLRGAVLPVIDLRKRFNLPPVNITKDSRIVTISIDTIKVGMIVDAVSEVLRVPEDAIEPTPPIVTTVDSAFITGIAKIDGRLIILLDLGKVLSLNEQEKLAALSAVQA
ncbi:MAG: chemotaxis protein CheW [Anaerolineales bacterium]|nr:chemotaxis protein CheW [Anaerolineales bacterium]